MGKGLADKMLLKASENKIANETRKRNNFTKAFVSVILLSLAAYLWIKSSDMPESTNGSLSDGDWMRIGTFILLGITDAVITRRGDSGFESLRMSCGILVVAWLIGTIIGFVYWLYNHNTYSLDFKHTEFTFGTTTLLIGFVISLLTFIGKPKSLF